MGVKSFYRWLVSRYPKIVVNAVEKTEENDTSLPNPNGIEFDNLYLDMNGIIHPCFHPEQEEANSPVTYDEVFTNIFDYIDRILNVVRPRKLLYMAIDGVAPRAKMNQQRSRRFRNAKDRQTLEEEEERLRRRYELEGRSVFPKVESNVADSNVITPGTEFMYELSKQLEVYIRLRIANHPAWRSLRVILSDASSPGEGEHKIMSFIRLQRTCQGYDPNTSHVLYGLDADLIMLALATHEIHFSILRENVLVEATTHQSKQMSILNMNQGLEDAVEQMSSLDISKVGKRKSLMKKPYQFLHVWILREYLKLDLNLKEMPEFFLPDMERLIDDFVFICFFAGNDFLPHMPTLEIHEGAIDLLMHVYTEEFKNLGGYLVDVQRIPEKKGCYLKLKRVEKFILAVGAYEDKIFKKRSAIHDSKLRRILANIQAAEGHEEDDLFPVMSHANNQKVSTTGFNVGLTNSSRSYDHDMQISENTKMLKEQLKSYTRESSDIIKNGLVTDLVKFGSPGWKKRYYKCKFSAETEVEMEKMRKNLVEKYTQGLCWVLLYYFSDVPSWAWYYPYHYGPFASDFKGLSSTKVTFNKGSPLKPFDQLMAVLPPTSAHALPMSYQSLMIDEESSILDFYPSDFKTDTDGKRFLWQGICKLPFIDEARLLSATKKAEQELGDEDAKRNVKNYDQLFVHSSENFASRIFSLFSGPHFIEKNNLIKIDLDLCGDINGFVRPKQELMKDCNVLCLYYELPCFSAHMPRVLAGSTIPEMVVTEADIEERYLWHDSHGYHNTGDIRFHNRTERSDGNPGVGFRNSCSDVVVKDGGSCWNLRGRGKVGQPSPGVGFRNSCPDVVVKGGGSGWNPRGRGKVGQPPSGFGSYSSHDASRWGNSCPDVGTIGRGRGWNPRGRGKAQQFPYGSDSGSWHDAPRTLNDQTRGPSWWVTAHGNVAARVNINHPARTNSSTGKVWTVRSTDSGSSSNNSSNK